MQRWWWLLAVVLLGGALADEAELDALIRQVNQDQAAGRTAAAQAGALKVIAQAVAEQRLDYEGAGQMLAGELLLLAGDAAAALPHYARLAELAAKLKDAEHVAYGQMGVGACHRAANHWAEALPWLRLAAAGYQQLGQPALAGRAVLLAADAEAQLGHLDELVTNARQAVDWLTGTASQADLIDAHFLLANGLVKRGDNREGRASFTTGLQLARAQKLPAMVAKGLRGLAELEMAEGAYAAADSDAQEAADLTPATAALAERLSGLVLLARVKQIRGRSPESLRVYAEAQRLAAAPGQELLLADVLNAYGITLTELGRYDDSLAALHRAEAIQRRQGNPLQLALVEANLALALSQQGNLRDSLTFTLRAVQVLEQYRLPETLATLYNNLGWLYDSQADWDSALRYYRRALELATAAHRPQLAALALNNLGLARYNRVLPELGQAEADAELTAEQRAALEEARDCFRQAVDSFRAAGDRRQLATALNNLGQVTGDLHQPAQAIPLLREALRVHRELKQLAGIAQTCSNLGMQQWASGQATAAIASLREAVTVSKRIGAVEMQSKALYNLALLEAEQGHLSEAIDLIQRSLAATERRRAGLGGDAQQPLRFMASNIRGYLVGVELLLAAHQTPEAFAVAERCRGRALLDMIDGGRVNLSTRLPSAEAAQLTALEAEAAAANLALSRLAAGEEPAEATLQAARTAVETARTELAAEETRLASLHPQIAASSGRQTVDLAGAARLLPPDTALCEYLFGQSEPLLFVVTNQPVAVRCYHLKTSEKHPREALTAALSRFHAACASPRGAWQERAADLYDDLIKPALADLPPGVKRLVVVPDQALYDCPFAALWDRAGQRFLADSYEIVYAASASLLGATLQLGDERRQTPATGALIVADPAFGQRTQDVATERGARGFELAPLPGTREEAAAIAPLLAPADLLAGTAAQERTIKQRLPRYRYLHFATHGLLDKDRPLASSVALAEPDQPGEDGFLEARELAAMNLHAELVTLSACQTGRGKAECGEGLIGLPWGFFVAGVPTQVVSLWSVDDFMTKELMTRFYRHLAHGEPKATALNAAGRELRQAQLRGPDGRLVKASHPFYWAPFVLLGDWR